MSRQQRVSPGRLAALKAWRTRRANARKRSEAALKAWETRRRYAHMGI
jgi:hypothetical protein